MGFLVWSVLFWFVGGSWLDVKRQEVCSSEVRQEHPDLELVKKHCIQTADHFMEQGYYGSAAWFYLLGGDVDKNLNEVEAKIDDGFYMNIGHSYVLKGEFEKAREIYEAYIWYEEEYYDQSDEAMQNDFKILPRLYADKKENLAKGLALWNEIYKPIEKIVTAYKNYERAEEEGSSSDAIRYLEQTLEYSADYKDREVLEYWMRVEMLAELYWNENKTEKAIEYYKKIEEVYLKDEEKAYEYQEILLSLAKLNREISNDGEALLYYNKVLVHKEQSDFDNNASLAVTYKDIGDVYSALKKPKRAIESYKKSIELQHHYLEDPDIYSLNGALEELEGYYTTLSNLYLEIGDTKQALSTREAYVSFLERAYEGDYKPLAIAHYNMASYFNEQNDTQRAIESHLMAIDDMQELIEREFEVTSQEDAVEILFDYYDSLEPYLVKSSDYNHTKAYNAMVGYMEELRAFQEKRFSEEEVNHLILAQTYNLMRGTYEKVDDVHKRKKYAQLALLQIKKAIEEEEDEAIKVTYADFLNSYYGSLLRESSMDLEERDLSIDEYMSFQREHYDGNFYLLSQAHELVALFFKDRKCVELAMEHYKKALTFAEEAFKEEESYENEQLVHEIYHALLRLYRDDYDNHAEAIRLTKELIALQKEKNADKKRWLSSGYDTLAAIYYQEDNGSEEIVKSYRASIGIFKEDIVESNSTTYFYDLRESYVTLSKYYAQQKDQKRSIAVMFELIDFTLTTFPHEETELARDYAALAEVYDLFEESDYVLIYKEKAFSTIERALSQSNNYGDYFNDFENHYDALQRLYQKRNETYKIVKSIEKLKEMIKGEPEEEYKISLLKMISYAYLRIEAYSKSLEYIVQVNRLVDTSYTFECSDIEESYYSSYIYLDEHELKSLEKVCPLL